MAQQKYYNTTTSQWEPVPLGALGVNSDVPKEVPTGLVNGTNKVFTTSSAYQPATLQVFINGLRQGIIHVTETNPSAGTFTLDEAPATGSNVEVSYKITGTSTGNADTVDGYHASATPAANSIPVLDSNKIITQEPWVAPSLLNGWVNFGGVYETVAYMKDTTNIVHIKGVVKGGTLGNSTPIFNLPPGYRPAMQMYTIQLSNGGIGQVDVKANGDVSIIVGSNLSLGLMISFRAEN